MLMITEYFLASSAPKIVSTNKRKTVQQHFASKPLLYACPAQHASIEFRKHGCFAPKGAYRYSWLITPKVQQSMIVKICFVCIITASNKPKVEKKASTAVEKKASIKRRI
ncbi:unnamed protein product [Ixodes pacificus]